MIANIGFQDLIKDDDIFDIIMWNIFKPFDFSENNQTAKAQLLTLKLVSKDLNESICKYCLKIKMSALKKYNSYMKNFNFIKDYSMSELMVLSRFSNEASLDKYLKYPHCYNNLEGVVTLCNLFDEVTFRLKIKLYFNKDALAAICKLSTEQKKVVQNFISQVIPLSHLLLHKNVMNFCLLPKHEGGIIEIIERSYISERWTYTLAKLLCKAINSLLQYKTDLEVLMNYDKMFSIYYDFPLDKHIKNSLFLHENMKLNKNYNLCIQTKNTYLNNTEETPGLIDYNEIEHIDGREAKLEKLVAVCWPFSCKSNEDTALLTFDRSSTFGVDSYLSPDFYEALFNIHSSDDL